MIRIQYWASYRTINQLAQGDSLLDEIFVKTHLNLSRNIMHGLPITYINQRCVRTCYQDHKIIGGAGLVLFLLVSSLYGQQ